MYFDHTFIHINIDITILLYYPRTQVLHTDRMIDQQTVWLMDLPKSISPTFDGKSDDRTDQNKLPPLSMKAENNSHFNCGCVSMVVTKYFFIETHSQLLLK